MASLTWYRSPSSVTRSPRKSPTMICRDSSSFSKRSVKVPNSMPIMVTAPREPGGGGGSGDSPDGYYVGETSALQIPIGIAHSGAERD